MPRQSAHIRKFGRPHHDTPVAFARAIIARMPGVLGAFVDHLQPLGLKPGAQGPFNVRVKPHYFHLAPSILALLV